ncbi:hypothetical protein L861_05100 [Litchfieldella anticariensis FP35 = DSM 16096]|uniref:DUF6708 domain-containing protein n=1 Tax=Litchfieldella anticariensis (strain DSM 16096 / CECT 5854 / CIP 108499 / LMG 22089 / FP35) TaxID=1121939 RepID=S2KH56_LITA3|nr:DUF6708 domain-containing protein [Halomonas anticariensis]EPC01417.1 hypothetical protein L861_05100 [Halomonas anticariensis FP35 = DSM 16096]
MHSIHNFFADLSQKLGLADEVIRLSPRRPAAKQPFQLGDVQEQNEVYLDLGTGADFSKGGMTGTLAWGAFYMAMFGLLALRHEGQLDNYLILISVLFGIVSAIFLIEVLLPFPMPVRFNRRTREVYFQDRHKLYHVPWDEAVAWMQQTRQVTQYTGATRMTLLQLLLQRFRRPEEVIALQLSLPLGKTPEIQGMLWEYLRCYMEKGPWFDDHGTPLAESNRGEVLKRRAGNKANLRGLWRNYMKGLEIGVDTKASVAFSVAIHLLLYPNLLVQDWTTAVARRRAEKNQWHALVRERCRADGPTTRLYDLELAEGLHPEAGDDAPAASSTGG